MVLDYQRRFLMMKQALQRQPNSTSFLFNLISYGPLIILRCYYSTSWRLVKIWVPLVFFKWCLQTINATAYVFQFICLIYLLPIFHQVDRDIICLHKCSHICRNHCGAARIWQFLAMTGITTFLESCLIWVGLGLLYTRQESC